MTRGCIGLGVALALLATGCSRIEAFVDSLSDDPPPTIPARDPAPAAGASDEATAEADAGPSAASAAAPPSGSGSARGDAGTVARMVAKMEAAKPKFPAYAVVRDGARMFVASNKAGGHFVAGGDDEPVVAAGYRYYGSPPPAEAKPTGRAVRIVDARGEMFEVEPVTTEDAALTCAPMQPELSRVRTRLWVERASLVPVLDAPVTVQLGEHSKITLAPGVPAFETEDEGTFRVVADGVELTLPLPEIPPARWHDPAAPFASDDAVGTLGTWYNMTFDGSTFPPDGAAGRQQGQLYGDVSGNTWIFADEIVDGKARVRVKNRCLDVEGVVVTDARSGKPTVAMPASARRRPQDRPPHVLAGTRLRWEDGTDAGVAVAPITFAQSPRVADADTCFTISSDAESPQLCVATTELDASPARLAEADGLILTASTGWASSTEVDVEIVDQMWEHSEPMRTCFRKRVGTKPGYNYASANINLGVDDKGVVTVNWGSAWTATGSSTKLQTCLEDIAKGFVVTHPPPEQMNVSLSMSVTRY